MKRINYKIIINVLIALFVCELSSAQELKLLQTSFNFGDITLKEKKIVELKVVNNSNKPIVVKKASVDCDCTKIKFSKKPIMPSDTVVMKITFEAKDKGAFYKRITLEHSANEKFSTIVLRGTVK